MTTSSSHLSNKLLVGEILKRASHHAANKVAFSFKGRDITFQQLDDRSTHLAGWLQSQNVQKNTKVAFMLRNSILFSEIAFGIALSGGVGVPINFRLTENEVSYILDNSDSEVVFVDKQYASMVVAIAPSLGKLRKIVVVHAEEHNEHLINYEDIFNELVTYVPDDTLTDDDASFIMYTSGTTGKPKGAVLSHRNLYFNTMNVVYEGKSIKGESNILVAPQFHIAGLVLTMKGVLTTGTTVVLEEFNPVEILHVIEKEKINTIFLVPAMWNFLFQVPNIADYDLSSITTCATGAAISPVELKQTILKYFKNAMLFDHFGQSETTATTTCLVGADALRKPESVGRPFANVEVRIVDEEMNDVPVGEIGEIVYRGPTIMKEYYNNPDETAEAFRGGWFHSGDLVKADKEGFIYVVDRINDMIISGGENIYPAEIEAILYQMPEILECAVLGVPDDEWGERVIATVVLKEGKILSKEAILNYCGDKLASFKKPREVVFIEQLPRNTTGKVLKYQLRETMMQEN